jgi:hypothetical protein
MKKVLFILGICLLTYGCAYNSKVVSTGAPAAEIRADKRVDAKASVFISPEIENLQQEVKPSSFVCSAHRYPLEVGNGLKQSIRKVMESSFQDIIIVKSNQGGEPGCLYQFDFQLDSFNPTLRFAQGFWSASINANTELVLKVMVRDAAGKEIVRTSVSGEGSANGDGQCGAGAEVLVDATQKSIKRTLENFVYKIINSDYFVKKVD